MLVLSCVYVCTRHACVGACERLYMEAKGQPKVSVSFLGQPYTLFLKHDFFLTGLRLVY